MSLPYLCIPIDKAALGLDQVDNTSDVNKPVSTAQAAADAVVASNAAADATTKANAAQAAAIAASQPLDSDLTAYANAADAAARRTLIGALGTADIAGKANLTGGNTISGNQLFVDTVVIGQEAGSGTLDLRDGSLLLNDDQIPVAKVDGAATATELDAKANLEGGNSFTGLQSFGFLEIDPATAMLTADVLNVGNTANLPSSTQIGSTQATEIAYLQGVSSSIQDQLDEKAPLAGPTFTGTVTLPSTTSIGSVSSTELGYLDGVTSAIQTQINAKVTGPASATDNALVRYDGTTGKLVQNSGATLDDDGFLQVNDIEGLNSIGVAGGVVMADSDGLRVTSGFTSLDAGAITTNGSGALTAEYLNSLGNASFDNGGVSTDGFGVLSAVGIVAAGSGLSSSGGITVTFGGAILDNGAITTNGDGQMNVGSVIINNAGEGGLQVGTDLTVIGTTSLDSGAITTNGSGNLTVGGDVVGASFYNDNMTIYSDGGIYTTNFLEVVGTTSLDNTAITTDGSGNLTAAGLSTPSGSFASLFDGSGGFVLESTQSSSVYNGTGFTNTYELFIGGSGYVAQAVSADSAATTGYSDQAGQVVGAVGSAIFVIDSVEYYPNVAGGVLTFSTTP